MQSLCRKGEATAELLNDIQVVALAGWVRCLHCHGDVYRPDGGGSMDRDR